MLLHIKWMNANKVMRVMFCLAGSSLWEGHVRSAMWLMLVLTVPSFLFFPLPRLPKIKLFLCILERNQGLSLKALD